MMDIVDVLDIVDAVDVVDVADIVAGVEIVGWTYGRWIHDRLF